MAENATESAGVRITDQQLRYLAAAFAYLVAGIHLFHPKRGFPRLVILLQAGTEHLVYDPRPVAFVLSGLAIIFAIKLVLFGVPRRPIYLLGMLLMVTYFTGYFAWHLSGHGGFLPMREPLYHGLQPHEAVISHLREDSWAVAAKLSEATLFTLLAVLYRRES